MKQKNKNINPFNYAAKKYNNYIFDATTKYQKQYGFDMGTGSHATWNNEADAFKHPICKHNLPCGQENTPQNSQEIFMNGREINKWDNPRMKKIWTNGITPRVEKLPEK